MAVVAIANLKGGVGKTALAINLACALAGKLRVVLLDADTQATACAWSAPGKLAVEVIPAPLERRGDAERWSARVAALAATADLLVIDTAPHLDVAMSTVALVADLLVIPCGASGADLIATRRAVELVREARTVRRGTLPAVLLVPSRIDRRTSAGREIESALRSFGEPIGPAIGQRSAHVDAFSAGLSVGQYAPSSTAAVEIAALAGAVRRRL